MKGKKRVHAFKNRMEHWQVVSIGLTVYDAIAMILAFFMALWFRFDCRYTMIPKEYLNFYFKFILTLKPHFLRNRSIPRVCRIS